MLKLINWIIFDGEDEESFFSSASISTSMTIKSLPAAELPLLSFPKSYNIYTMGMKFEMQIVYFGNDVLSLKRTVVCDNSRNWASNYQDVRWKGSPCVMDIS